MNSSTEDLKHTGWDCKYRVVFVPKYRKKILWMDTEGAWTDHTGIWPSRRRPWWPFDSGGSFSYKPARF
jgi:hypothetical protein